ncbi:MAG TPA: extracellular solute-binding protein, partial [Pilimelia sp.]|nr:extracellular solute-binding protein [Pilimelia sp.]
MTRYSRRALLRGAAATCVVALAVTGCGSGDEPDSDPGAGAAKAVSAEEIEAALQAGGTIKVWAWEPTLKQVVAKFRQKYPKVTVDLVNAGTGNDQYTALQNAIAAGAGVPDVAHIEYFALPQFALAKSLTDLTPYGAKDLQSAYTPGPFSSVSIGGSIFGLPMDSGPMVMFYNKEVFDKHNIAVPATWDEYVAAARKLHQADPKAYITADSGDPGFVTSMVWQAGGKPYKVDGTTVTINFADDGVKRFASTWQPMISEKLVSSIGGWTEEWFQALGNGTIATLTTGAWMPANLQSGAPAGKGKWRAAPMPQWEAGGKATAESGGSSLAIPAASKNKTLAYGFLKYANADEGVQIRLDNGAFPATTAHLASPEFLNTEFPYFGGQKINEVMAEAAKQVVPGWSYLPFQVYANSIFNDTAGKAYVSGTP